MQRTENARIPISAYCTMLLVARAVVDLVCRWGASVILGEFNLGFLRCTREPLN
jgi:hypothetical protein